jgi:hypothetical protein
MTPSCMSITIAAFAFVPFFANRRSPRKIIEKWFAFLAVQSSRVMCALASSMNHVSIASDESNALIFNRNTARGMTIARTTASNDRIIDCIVIFFSDFRSIIQKVVTKCVKLGEIYSQVRNSQKILNFFRIWIF